FYIIPGAESLSVIRKLKNSRGFALKNFRNKSIFYCKRFYADKIQAVGCIYFIKIGNNWRTLLHQLNSFFSFFFIPDNLCSPYNLTFFHFQKDNPLVNQNSCFRDIAPL